MKIHNCFIIVMAGLIIIISCSDNDVTTAVDDNTCECNIDIATIDFNFGIDYENPQIYLIPGKESDLSDSYLEEIRHQVGTPGHSIDDILNICHWINQNFSFKNAGGAMAGKNTVDELYEIKTFYGCHSLALLISSVVREFGFPAIMIETAHVDWGYAYNAGDVTYFSGHVMSEIYVDNKWIVFDNNCTFVEDYDPLNPFISSNSAQGDFFVYAKGIDIWDYTGRDDSFTHDKMVYFAENICCFEKLFNSVNYNWSR